MTRLCALTLGLALLGVAPAGASAAVLPGIADGPVLERQTVVPGCPLGFALLPGTVCPPAEQIPPDDAEQGATPRPPGPPIRTTPAPYSAHSMVYACCTPPRADGARVRRRPGRRSRLHPPGREPPRHVHRTQGPSPPPRLERRGPRGGCGSPLPGARRGRAHPRAGPHHRVHHQPFGQLPGRRRRVLRALRGADRRTPGRRGRPPGDRQRARREVGVQGLAAGVRADAGSRPPPHPGARAGRARPAGWADVQGQGLD